MRNIGYIIEKLKSGEVAPNRHFNPYLSEALEYEGILFTTTELESTARSQFLKNQKPLVIEIGCYLGKNLIEMANENSNTNFLGLDITYKRVVKTARRIKTEQIKNAFVGICDGKKIFEFADDNSISGVCVFFPDPWSKIKHQKHRLLNDSFFENIFLKLAHDGFFWFKTDHLEYFQATIALIEKSGLKKDQALSPSAIRGGPYVTMFENIFIEKKLPTYEVTYFKP